jgi:transposase
MNYLKYSVGIDVSKADFKANISVIDIHQKVSVKASSTFNNTSDGFEKFMVWTKKHHKETNIPIHFLMEATGVYYENLAWFLFKLEQKVSVILPNKAKKYLQSLGHKSKNDKIDAKGLAQMGAEQNLGLWQPISKNIYVLRSLTRLHESFSVQLNGIKNQLHALQYGMFETESAEIGLKSMINQFEVELCNLKKLIIKTVEEDEVLYKKYKLISPIKGIGLMTFAVLVAETNGFALFNNVGQLTSYAGYDVVENQSGSFVGKTRISKKGNAHIRRILFMPAFNAVKDKSSIFYDLYERVYERTGLKMKGYVAVQRKLLSLVYVLWKKDVAYDVKFRQNQETVN